MGVSSWPSHCCNGSVFLSSVPSESLVTESYPDPMGKGNSLLYTEVEGESPLSPFPAAQVKLTVLTMGKDEGKL